MNSENTANQIEEVESSDSVVNIRQLLALVFSAGGVQAMTAIVGILTIKFVSPLGSQTIAAVTGGQRLIFIVLAIMLGLSVGTMAHVSRSVGQNNLQQANEWLRAALLLGLLICVGLSVIFWIAAGSILGVMGLSGQALLEGIAYMRQLCWFIVFIGFYLLLASALRAMNMTTIPLVCGLFLNALTIYLTYHYINVAVETGSSASAAVSFSGGGG